MATRQDFILSLTLNLVPQYALRDGAGSFEWLTTNTAVNYTCTILAIRTIRIDRFCAPSLKEVTAVGYQVRPTVLVLF